MSSGDELRFACAGPDKIKKVVDRYASVFQVIEKMVVSAQNVDFFLIVVFDSKQKLFESITWVYELAVFGDSLNYSIWGISKFLVNVDELERGFALI